MSTHPILEVSDLSISFRRKTRDRELISNVVKGVGFDLHAGETVGTGWGVGSG